MRGDHPGQPTNLSTVQRGRAAAEELAAGSKFGEVMLDDGGLMRPHVRFYIELSREYQGLVHVRCYNNKYWVPEQPAGGISFAVMGVADKPEEDPSKPSCTLFEPTFNASGDHPSDPLRSVSFFHVQLKQYATFTTQPDMEGEPKERRPRDFFWLGSEPSFFILIDLSQLAVLPRYVAFKGNNGKYLRLGDNDYLEFTASQVSDPRAINTVVSNNDGTVTLKSRGNGRYWALERGIGVRCIRADAARVGTLEPEKVFKVAKVGNYFTLENIQNNQLCKSTADDRLGTEAGSSSSSSGSIAEEAKLLLEEPVLSREIYNVVYNETDSPRIYGGTDLSMVSASAVNRSAKESSKVKLSLKLTQKETRTWDTTVSHKAGVSTTIEVGIPKIGAGLTIEFDYEFSKSFSWGTVEEKQKEQNVEYEVTVPPMKKVTVSAVARQAKCDVPFSYTQKDVLYDGTVETTYHDDGMFTGMNSFDVQYVTREEDL